MYQWVQMMYHQLDYIKPPTTMVIWMSKIMMIQSYLRHLGKLISVLTLMVIQYPTQTHQDSPH